MLFKIAMGEVLRELRREKGITLRQLSKKSNVALGYISDIERGRKDPSSVVIQSLANGIGMSAAALIIESGYRMGDWDTTELSEEKEEEYV